MNLGLEGKVALVTGAGSSIGFGRAIALSLAREGCDIVANDINLSDAERTAAEIKALGRDALAIRADISNSAEVQDMVRVALDHFGKVDILVNNAGTSSRPRRPFVEKTEADWNLDIDVNLKGVLICTKAVLNDMISRKYGKIINISSSTAQHGGPNTATYAAAKAGVIGFTKSLAAEVAALGINVNSVAPGVAATGLSVPPDRIESIKKETPLGRITTPEDIASMVTFLASDVSNDIVGQTLNVNGGKFMM